MKIQYTEDVSVIRDTIEWHNQNSEYVVIDTETDGLDFTCNKLLLIVISGTEPDSALLFDPKHVKELNALKTAVVCHNFKFDFQMLYAAGVDLRHLPVRDTTILHHLLNENKSHKLDDIVKEYFNVAYKEEFWGKYKTFEEAPVEEQHAYAGRDVIYTGRVFERIYSDLKEDGIPSELIRSTHELASSLLNTEIAGLKVDIDYLLEKGIEIRAQVEELRARMRDAANTEITIIEHNLYLKELEKRKTDKGKAGVKQQQFNFDSSTQVKELLYAQLKLPVQVSKDRKPTVDDGALETLSDAHPLIPLLREYRGAQKIYNAFIIATLEKMHQGRIYPSFNVNGTVTGRISSSDPNMQQLPRSGGIRGIFVPDPGFSYISCDYSQLEVTIAAHFSRDAQLLRVVNEGVSLHDITAQALQIDRQVAKSINFAIQYGAGAHKIAKILSCSTKEAEQVLNKYWETYSGLKANIDGVHAKLKAGEDIVNPFGRHRRFDLGEDPSIYEIERAKRQAFNSLVQGSGAQLTHDSFYKIDKELRKLGIGYGLFPVHDEVIACVKNDAIEKGREIIQTIMVNAGNEIALTVPLKVDCSDAMSRWE